MSLLADVTGIDIDVPELLGIDRDDDVGSIGPVSTAGSTGLLDDLSGVYKPAMDKLREKKTSTALVDDARSTADNRYKRGVQAAEQMQAATGGMTTRQAALSRYQARAGGRANVDASINSARETQDNLQESASQSLLGMQSQLLGQKIDQQRHKETLTEQRAMQNERMKSANKNSKRGFWGAVGGIAAGAAAAALL